MTDFSGTLEGVGLPAIVRFLAGLQKTGCLRITHQDWRGEVYFDAGQVVGAALGSRQGLSALDALVQALPGGSFVFDTDARHERRVERAAQPRANCRRTSTTSAREPRVAARRLPSLDAIPALVPQDDDAVADETVPLDRGTLTTLLAIDGIARCARSSPRAARSRRCGKLRTWPTLGLVRLPAECEHSPTAARRPLPRRPVAVRRPARQAGRTHHTRCREPAPAPRTRPGRRAPAAAADGTRCPLPETWFRRRSHQLVRTSDPPASLLRRRHAAAAVARSAARAVPERSIRDLPALAMAGLRASSTGSDGPRRAPAPPQPGAARKTSDRRPAHRALAGRRPHAGLRCRGARRRCASAVCAPSSSVPTRAQSPRGILAAPTPLRARADPQVPPAVSARCRGRRTDAAPTPAAGRRGRRPPRPAAAVDVRREPAPRRRSLPFNLPSRAVAGLAMVFVLIAVVGGAAGAEPGRLFTDEASVDMSSLPNANAALAGTPISERARGCARPHAAAARSDRARDCRNRRRRRGAHR